VKNIIRLKFTDVSEEHTAFMFRVEGQVEGETASSVPGLCLALKMEALYSYETSANL
jgi:hypothetical protein